MNLYRIISFETFIGLIEKKEERYTRPVCWEDCYESYLLESLDSQQNRKKLIKILYTKISPFDPRITVNNFMKLWYAKWWTYAQCWSRERDSDAMWRIYSYNKHSIQICTNKTRIQNLFRGRNEFLKIEAVKYDVDDKTDIFMDQVYAMKETLSVYEPYFHKRQAFKHENEYRVIIADNSKQVISNLSAWAATHNFITSKRATTKPVEELSQKIEENLYKFSKENVNNNLYVPIRDLSEYIMEVRVNPFAEDWFVELIADICKKHGLKFSGKSKLYIKK